MRWKIFQWGKFLFRRSSNLRKLSQQKFYNELACVFTAHEASKNADWNQQQLTDGGILANWNSANYYDPYCFLSNQKKVQILAFLHGSDKEMYHALFPWETYRDNRERAWSQATLSFAGLPPTFSSSLSFSCSIFQICRHDNLSKLNTLDNTETEKISAFRFRLNWLFCCLCFTRRRWLCDFPGKITSSCISVAIPVDWVILHWYACGADRWSLGRAVGRCTVTWLPTFLGRVDHFIF